MQAYVRLRNCRGMAFDNDRGGLLTHRMDDESKLETPESSGSAEFARAQFARDGYAVVRGLVDIETCRQARRSVMDALDPLMGPAEFEADVGYPGAPSSRDVAGGRTPRRLFNAASRFPMLAEWATGAAVRHELAGLFGRRDVWLSQCHHNCIMTKYPGYSSATLWHQDIRYWSFDRPELISVWAALGDETRDNGALKIIPGSHRLDLDRGRFDRDLFLRPDLPENEMLIDRAEDVIMAPGDVLFFHCRTFHAAGKNRTDTVKLSGVFTYHTEDNRPIPGTRSDLLPSLPL